MTINKIAKAHKYAQVAHEGQTRTGSGEPYFNHVLRVADNLSKTFSDTEMICAAYLHDVVEDTEKTIEDIQREFGDVIAGYVAWLTKTTVHVMGNRETRRKVDRAKLALAPLNAKIIKLYDMYDNLSDLEVLDDSFAEKYREEKRKLLDVLGDDVKGYDIYDKVRALV